VNPSATSSVSTDWRGGRVVVVVVVVDAGGEVGVGNVDVVVVEFCGRDGRAVVSVV